jgi:hypothetical protein
MRSLCSISAYPEVCSTGPNKAPVLQPVLPLPLPLKDLFGTYDVPGYGQMHFLSKDAARGVPTEVKELRDRFTKPSMFGRLGLEPELLLIWANGQKVTVTGKISLI